MANFWDNDPIVENTQPASKSMPWDSDPVFQNTPALRPAGESRHYEFGEVPNDETGQVEQVFTNEDVVAEQNQKAIDNRNDQFSDLLRSIEAPLPIQLAEKGINAVADTLTGVSTEEGNAAREAYNKDRYNTFPQDVAGGVYNATPNLVELGAAGVDFVADKTLGVDTGLAETWNENVPRYRPAKDSVGGSIVTTASEMMTGSLGAARTGLRTVGTAVENPGVIKRTLTGVGNIAREALGAGATASTNTDSLLIGEDGLMSMGLDTKTGKYSEDILNKRANLAMDSFATAIPVVAGLKAIAPAARLVNDFTIKPIRNFMSQNAQNEVVGRRLLDVLSGVNSDTPVNERILAGQRITEILSDPANKGLKDEIQLSAQELLDLTPAQRAVYEGTKRDTATVIESGLENDARLSNADRDNLIATARNAREGVIRQNADGAEVITSRIYAPEKGLGQTVSEAIEQSGGREGATQAMDVVQGAADDAVNTVKASAKTANDELLERQTQLATDIVNDPTFASQVDELGKVADVDIYKGTRQSVDDLSEALYKAKQNIDSNLNELSNKIDPNTPIDNARLFDINQELMNNPDINRVLDKKTLDTLTSPDSNFKELFEITKKLSPAISVARNSNNPVLANLLSDARSIINNPIGDAPSVKEFQNYYKNTWARFFRDGKLEDYSNLYVDKVKSGIRPVDSAVESSSIIKGSLSDVPQTQHMFDLLQTPEGGAKGKLISDFYMNEAVVPIRQAINRGDTTGIQGAVDATVSRLEQMGGQVASINPELKIGFDNLIQKINTGRNDVKTLEAAAKEADALAKGAEAAIYGDQLKPFFDKAVNELGKKTQFKPSGNAFNSFSEMFTNKDNIDMVQRVTSLVEQSGDEVAQAGLKAAYNNALKSKLFQSAQGSTGGSRINATFVRNEAEGKSALLEYGEYLYREKPGYMKFMKALINEADSMSKARSSTSMSPVNPREIDLGAKGAVETITTMIFGPLSRRGSTTRKIGGKVVEFGQSQQRITELVTRAMADPDEMYRLLKPVLEKDTKIIDSPTYKANLTSWFFNGATKGIDTYSDEDDLEATQGIVNTAKDVADYVNPF